MAVRCIASFLPSAWNPAEFIVCGTITSAVNERSRVRRQSLFRRIGRPEILMFVIYIFYASAPLLAQFAINNPVSLSDNENFHFPFPGVWTKLTRSISNVTIPLWYMIWPPAVPDWPEWTAEDEDGVQRPSNEWENEGRGNGAWWVVTVICEIWIMWSCFRDCQPIQN